MPEDQFEFGEGGEGAVKPQEVAEPDVSEPRRVEGGQGARRCHRGHLGIICVAADQDEIGRRHHEVLRVGAPQRGGVAG